MPGFVDVPYLVLEPTHNKQDFADAKEYRHLQQQGQAAAKRIDLLFFPQLHLRLHEFLFVIPALFFQGGYFWCQLAHLGHGLQALRRQRVQDDLDDQREQQNGKAVFSNNGF